VFGLLVMTQVWLLVGFIQHRPDAPAPPPQQHRATPRTSATAPPRSF
jgi:hypothetical protein